MSLGEADLQEALGESFERLASFEAMLRREGVLRGLIGPQEAERLWDRHLLNSAAVVPFMRDARHVIDVGSGAGLPGVVIACMLPDVRLTLIEPMERRCLWLSEVVEELALRNVEIRRGRAEEFHGAVEADVVTARAVAALGKLARWCVPLLEPGGSLVALKGRTAADEVEKSRSALRRLKISSVEVLEAPTIPQGESTTVVRLRKGPSPLS